MIMASAIMFSLQSCEEKITINTNDFGFEATNLTVNEGKLSAYGGGTTVNVNWTVNVTINGESTSKSRKIVRSWTA